MAVYYGNVTLTNPSASITIPNGGYTIGGTGSSTATWTNTTYPSSPHAAITANGKLRLNGNNADIEINGEKLSDWMKTVNNRLAILQPKEHLKEKYEALQQAYDHYKTLEALCQDHDNSST